MALQCRHRLSEDLDFWLPHGTLANAAIRPALEAARLSGFEWTLTTPPNQIGEFRIRSGVQLENCARDYAVGGVRVQFFAPYGGDNDAFVPLIEPAITGVDTPSGWLNSSFRIMSLAGLFAMKSHIITRRHRTRDILDLWHFIQMGRSVAGVIAAARASNAAASADHIISVLRGDEPVDADDEGFLSLAPDADIARIRADFCAWTDAYEQERARLLQSSDKP